MSSWSERYIPLIVSVGQVVIFPFYILWLKEAALTFTLFSWLFAAFSFSGALGYRVYQTGKMPATSIRPLIYIGMGSVYILAGFITDSFEVLPYIALIFQVALGFLQGYHHAWHIEHKGYRLHAIHHYLLVGMVMVGLSFVKIISPVLFITIFGVLLFICGSGLLLINYLRERMLVAKTKYFILWISLIVFSIIGMIVHIEYIKADEYANFDGSLQAAYKAMNLEIINMLYFPIILLTHLIVFAVFKYNDAKLKSL